MEIKDFLAPIQVMIGFRASDKAHLLDRRHRSASAGPTTCASPA